LIRQKGYAAPATSRTPPDWFEVSAKRWPPRLNWNAHAPPALSEMDKLFLAVVVSGILVLIAAAGLFALAREKTAVQAPPFATRQQRH
jgi:hypothetical protein